MITELELIETQLTLLRSLPYVTGYTGSLNNIIIKSYVELYEITKKIGELEKQKRELLKNNKNEH